MSDLEDVRTPDGRFSEDLDMVALTYFLEMRDAVPSDRLALRSALIHRCLPFAGRLARALPGPW